MEKYLFVLLIAAMFSRRQKSIDGVYVGLERICWTDSAGKKGCLIDDAHPSRKWYHLSYLKIKGNKVFMDQDPVAIDKKDTIYSASDGAFYYYTGKIDIHNTAVAINLTQQSCDYCAETIKTDHDKAKIKKPVKYFSGQLKNKGLMLNGIFFRKMAADKMLESERHSAGK